MKKFVSIAVVVTLLLAAALYYGSLNKKNNPDTPDPTPEPIPVVKQDPVNKGAQPISNATVNGTLSLSAAISQGYLADKTVSDVYATIDIDAVKYAGSKRPPLNVSIVIDRSGSMAGDKIDHAKQAARKLVDVLGDGDRVSIVSYGSDVSVDFSSRPVNAMNREHMLAAIDGISVGGGTNLSGGFERGLSEVVRWKDKTSINRVLLMSDGNANLGVTYLPELERMSREGLASGVSLSTVGMGLDYNEDLMTGMANVGAGNYYFVDNSASIVQTFETELKGLAASVARDTAPVIKLAPGVSLSELYGFPYTQNGDSVMISLAEFRSEQKKSVLMKLRVPGDTKDRRDVLGVSLSYTDLLKDNALTNHDVALASVVTTDAAKVEESTNKHVIARVQQIEVANSMQQAMKLYEKGDTLAAQGVITKQQKRMRKARSKFGLKDKSYDRVDAELSGLNSVLGNTSNTSAEGRRTIKAKKARSNYIMFDSDAF